MKKLLIALALALASTALHAQGYEARIAYCLNPASSWIPVNGTGSGTIAPAPNGILLYGTNSGGTPTPVACDASGNLTAAANPSSGLVAQWKLNEGSGSVVYDSGPNTLNSAYSGTASGVSNFSSGGHVTPWGFFLDGTDNFVDVPTNAAITLPSFSISAWVNAKALTNAYSAIVLQQASSTRYAEIFVKSTGKMAWFMQNAVTNCNADGTGTATALTTGTWHLVTLTYTSGGNAIGYVDGVADVTISACSALGNFNVAGDIYIGKDNFTAGRFLNGTENDVRMYNRALTSTEITAMVAQHN
jgi:hypothetical protein